nr:tyrosine-type recombinase/integrase [Actinomycetota bacterium]
MSVQPVPDTASGGSLPPRALGDRVVSHLTELGVMAPISLIRVADLIRGFANYLAASGVESSGDITEAHASAFVRSLTRTKTEPSLATMHLRRTALRIFFREAKALGVLSVDPTTTIPLPPRSYRELRPLLDREIDRCRSFAEQMEGETRYAIAWALAEATARVAELGAIRAKDLDLVHGHVWIGGSMNTDARWSELTDWGVNQLQRVVTSRSKPPPDRSLLMPGTTSRGSVHEFVASTLRQAGLAKTSGVRPNSIPAWRGATELANGASIDEVAVLLGMRSLDRAATFIGFDWRAEL